MTSALVISRAFPDEEAKVHGVYQRLGAQVEALGTVVDRVECLFLVPAHQNCSPEELHKREERLRQIWSPAVSIRLVSAVMEHPPRSTWQLVREGIFDFQRQPIARNGSTEAAVAAVSAALEARHQIVLAHRLDSMSVLMKLSRQSPHRIAGIPLFFDMDDVEHVASVRRLLRDPSWPGERLFLLQLPALMLAEIRAMRLAATTFVCSEADRRRLARLSRGSQIRVVPNSVVFPPVAAHVTEPLVLFVGAMGYRPNAQAADLLVRDIWPEVRARVPAARLAIVGRAPEHAASYRSTDESVTFTGFVEDLEPWYRRARVVCCPIYHGSGTRVKIIEAAAHARAVVSTRLGAEGLAFEDEREIIVRDSPADLGSACVRLLNDPDAAARLGQAAFDKARNTYERSVVVDQLADLFRAGKAIRLREQVLA
jgi:glycosyltransferase involved in cell wall biosynthesis